MIYKFLKLKFSACKKVNGQKISAKKAVKDLENGHRSYGYFMSQG